MDPAKAHGGDYALFAQERRQREREQAYEDSLAEDLGQEFLLPISHRPTENLDTDNLEQASVDTQLSSSNVGFRLLQRMGWKGKGLGKDEQGIVEPIRAGARDAKLGLGKQEQDDFYTAEENVHRRKLEVEMEETEELTKKREVEAEREQKIVNEVREIRKVFFCELCNKQYKLAVEFETHLSSYDHNHRKRFKEMRELQGNRDRDDRQKREQVRQQREMAKFLQTAEAQRQQQQQQEWRQQQQQELEARSVTSNPATSVPVQDQRTALKFGFAAKPASSKMASGTISKKTKIVGKVAAAFKNDSDEE
ncbi:hypothetical protein O6H91_07G018300 [Diphasiastrum complanatum]|uniref:Uncharacterized protein n=1 Tax=Diphasiastrum complanatum TaxID=34168 RepID=A0ACC2D367_DIPCM|nr:hypothetical protein O6H91_07G018300 [Diphasiastrum complanatum]